jgi:hypothetical protein
VKAVQLAHMTINELVERFAEIDVAQDQAELMGEIEKFNQLHRKMDETENELRRRGREARLALLLLYDHLNVQVRLKRRETNARSRARGSLRSSRQYTIPSGIRMQVRPV